MVDDLKFEEVFFRIYINEILKGFYASRRLAGTNSVEIFEINLNN